MEKAQRRQKPPQRERSEHQSMDSQTATFERRGEVLPGSRDTPALGKQR